MRLSESTSRLPAAFFVAFRHCLGKWMLVYDYEAASEHAEMLMLDREADELADSIYPKVAPSLPACLPRPAQMNPRYACSILRAMQPKTWLKHGSRELVSQLLEMWKHSTGYSHYWPYRLIRRIPGLDDYLEECDGIGPGCLLNWYEDDPISACFDEEMSTSARMVPLAPCILRVIRLDRPKRVLDQQVGELFDYVAAMIRSLAAQPRSLKSSESFTMNIYVDIGSSQDFRLTRALLIYGKNSYDSIPYRHPFVTLHEVFHDDQGARLGEGQLATPRMLIDLVAQLGRSVPVEILPERVLVRTPERIVWWTPACAASRCFSATEVPMKPFRA